MGISTPNLPSSPVIDELIGNRTEGGVTRTIRAPVGSVMAGYATTEAIEEFGRRIDELQVEGDSIIKATWAELAAVAGTRDGQRGIVPTGDTGTHTDPVAGGTVPNSGIYSWSVSPAGWQRVGDYQDVQRFERDLEGKAEFDTIYRALLWEFEGDAPSTLEAAPAKVTEDGKILATFAPIGSMPSGGSASPVVTVVTADGQSNSIGAASDSASLVYSDGRADLLTIQRNGASDFWQGNYTGGGASVEIPPEELTGLAPLTPRLNPAGGAGTTATEAAARALLAEKPEPVICWNAAEGGQTIWRLLPSDNPAAFAFKNAVTRMQRAQALKAVGSRLVYRWMLMHQGESDRSTANLGKLHNDLRVAVEERAKAIFGQTEAVRMISFQPSSGAVLSAFPAILDFARQNQDAGLFFCGGPSYPDPFSGDWLHHTSLGHARRGERAAAIMRRAERDGVYLPLHALSARRIAGDTIEVVFSEGVEVATDDVVLAINHLGVDLVGGAISTITLSGDRATIRTVGAAADVTQVRFGFNAQTSPGAQENVPRTNIRAKAPLGVYSFGGLIRAWMCHQTMSVVN